MCLLDISATKVDVIFFKLEEKRLGLPTKRNVIHHNMERVSYFWEEPSQNCQRDGRRDDIKRIIQNKERVAVSIVTAIVRD